ncbi:MAG: hypothetical protein B6242_05295 [Anaerolineaceae bacterium 4572_78]|nr:MAG: hypothetical protein B6242_05295 [Anaerolineaceae bacterium 4572_78]
MKKQAFSLHCMGEILTNNELITVDHIADFYRRYPGDDINFFTRIQFLTDVTNVTLRISLPEELTLADFYPPPDFQSLIPDRETGGKSGRDYLVWRFSEPFSAGSTFTYRTTSTVVFQHPDEDFYIENRAEIIVMTPDDEQIFASESVRIKIFVKGQYLNHLPNFYYSDDFMGRYLMLFEDFWSPIEEQLHHIAFYFDPCMTPAIFRPWLASWFDFEFDEHWSEKKRCLLLKNIMFLYRKRGTKAALAKYLEIYTGGEVEISEKRGKDFTLGPEARLGLHLALGTNNNPHTFEVDMTLPPIEADDEEEKVRLELERAELIDAIIKREKPSHTNYTLTLE